jgi:AraC family transcriptional regulator of arabinose operon
MGNGMRWQGDIAFSDTAVAFKGDSADNRRHAHAAVQCVFSASGVVLLDSEDTVFSGAAWLIRSGVAHCLNPTTGLVLVLIEPQSRLATTLLQAVGEGPIVALPGELTDLMADAASSDELLRALERRAAAGRPQVDRRILRALDNLDVIHGRNPALTAALHAGISPSHLRALCREHFGVPFSKLLLWRKVRRAFIALSLERSLADAAAEAGFADQAHLTRTMTEVVGLTAGEAARAGR